MKVPRIVGAVAAKTTKSRIGYAGWGFADQAMSSLSNFGVGLVAARASTSEEFGAFSIAFATSVLGVGISRALVAEVYSVRFSGGSTTFSAASGLDPDSGPGPDALGEIIEVENELQAVENGGAASAFAEDDGGARYPQATGTLGLCLLLGLLAGCACAGASLFVGGSLSTALMVLAVGMPFLVVQDVGRYICITRRDAFGATISDTVWVVSFAVAVAVLTTARGGFPTASYALGAWVFGAACAAAVGFARLHALPRLSHGIAFWRRIWRQSMRYFVDWMSFGASIQLAYYLLGFTAGLAVVGELRAAMLLAGPLNIVLMGAVMLLVPEVTRYRRRTGSRLFRVTALVTAALAVVVVLWIGFVSLLPDSLIQKFLGDAATSAVPLLPYVLLSLLTTVLAQGPLGSLRATGDVRRGTMASLPTAPFYLCGMAIGAGIFGGAEGALIGGSVANLIAAALGTYFLIIATREAPIDFVEATSADTIA